MRRASEYEIEGGDSPLLLAVLDRLAFVNGKEETSEEESPDQKESRSQGLCANGLGCCAEDDGELMYLKNRVIPVN